MVSKQSANQEAWMKAHGCRDSVSQMHDKKGGRGRTVEHHRSVAALDLVASPREGGPRADHGTESVLRGVRGEVEDTVGTREGSSRKDVEELKGVESMLAKESERARHT